MKHRIKPFKIEFQYSDYDRPRWGVMRAPKGVGYTSIDCVLLENKKYHCVVYARKYQTCDVNTIEEAEKWITDTYVALLDARIV